LQALDAGQTPDRDELIRAHPECAAELAAFFADQDKMAQWAHGAHSAAPTAPNVATAPTVPPGEETVHLPGSLIGHFGDYESLEEIARGGMVLSTRPGKSA
jgi:hypothetical protein